MKVEREVIIDLLPAYFSGEASAATRALVENYFRENPDFEKTARSANWPLEELKVPASALADAKEKLALEKARQINEARSAFLFLGICLTVMLLLFGYSSPLLGGVFGLMAIFFWLLYFNLRVKHRTEPMPRHTVFLWLACFYSVLPFMPRIHDHKITLFFFTPDDSRIGVFFVAVAVVLWIAYFVQRRKDKRASV